MERAQLKNESNARDPQKAVKIPLPLAHPKKLNVPALGPFNANGQRQTYRHLDVSNTWKMEENQIFRDDGS